MQLRVWRLALVMVPTLVRPHSVQVLERWSGLNGLFLDLGLVVGLEIAWLIRWRNDIVVVPFFDAIDLLGDVDTFYSVCILF